MALVFNRASDNYLFHGSEFKAGSNRTKLTLSTANNETVIDLCNNGNVDISGTLFVGGQELPSGANTVTLSGTQTITGDKIFNNLLNANGGIAVDTDKFTVADTTGNTAVAGTLDVTGATTLTGALGATTINASGAVGVDGDFDVATDKFTVASGTGNTAVAGTLAVTGATTLTGALGVTGKITATGGLDISGDLLPTTNSTQIPVTYSTFKLVTANLNTDLSSIGTSIDDTTYVDATDWSITRTPLSEHSYIKMEFKANFISSPEFDQTLSFKVLRSIDQNSAGDNYNTTVFEDTEIGSNMGVTIRGVYNGTYIDDLNGLTLGNAGTVSYKLQVKRNKASGDTIQTAFGIVPGGNYIFLQELYQPSA